MPDGSNVRPSDIDVKPDFAAAAQHIELLTGSAETRMCFRVIAPTREARNINGTLAGCWRELERLNLAGAQVYFVVNEGGHDADAITRIRALFIDMDGKPLPEQWHVEPDFLVRRDETHWHAYWRVNDMPVTAFTQAQKRLIAHYGSDPGIHDLPRILRLAGSVHVKHPTKTHPENDGIPRLVTIKALGSWSACSVVEVLAGLPETTGTAETATEPRDATAASDLAAADLLDLAEALHLIANPDLDWSTWSNVGMALFNASGRSEAGKSLWLAFSAKAQGKFEEEKDALERWAHWFKHPPDRIGAGTIYHLAGEACPGWERPSRRAQGERFRAGATAAFAGVEQPASDDPAKEERARIEAKFMRPVPGSIKTRDMRDLINSDVKPPPRRDLVPEWIEAGFLILVAGRGGIHKSRLLMQLIFCLLYERQLFVYKGDNDMWGPDRGRGIPVNRVEFLSYEDEEDEIGRRVAELKEHFDLTNDTADRWQYHDLTTHKAPLLRVNDNAKVELTDTGYQMLCRWEKLAQDGGHTVIWLDSFINAVAFLGTSKNNDACVDAAIGVCNRWCALLNATIITPFHTSRGGDGRGDIGYSPRFEDAPRQVLMLRALLRKVTGQQGQYEQTGEFRFTTHKWNHGPQGKKLTYWYDHGQLVTAQPMQVQDMGNPISVAAELVLHATYQDAITLKKLASPDLSDEDRAEIERRHPDRIRRAGGKGGRWRAPSGCYLSVDDGILREFRFRTSNNHASVETFIAACENAVRVGKLGYRDYRDTGANGTHRLPAGFCAPVARADETVGKEPWDDNL